MLQDCSTYTPEELERWIHLPALEWSAWPTFISQPVLPLLLTLFPWHMVLIGVLCADAAWQLLQHGFVSAFLSEVSCLGVRWLMWQAALGSSIFLLVHGRYGLLHSHFFGLWLPPLSRHHFKCFWAGWACGARSVAFHSLLPSVLDMCPVMPSCNSVESLGAVWQKFQPQFLTPTCGAAGGSRSGYGISHIHFLGVHSV